MDVVWASELSRADGDDYDRFVQASAAGHYAQTRAFAPVARASRPSVVRYFLAREGGRVVGAALIARGAVLGAPLPVASAERGPVVQEPRDLARVVPALARAARARGVAWLTVMPYWANAGAGEATRALEASGFRDVQRADGAHARTLRVDLTTTDEGALVASRPRLRRRVTQAARAGATVRRGTRADYDEHRRLTVRMMRAQGKAARGPTHHDALWSAMLADASRGALFVCELERRIVATVVALRHGDVAVYAQGATTLEPSPISKSVPPLLAAMAWARAEGCRVFDLGGVPGEDDADDKRRRIAHLKLDFDEAPVTLVREHGRLF